MKKEVLRSPDYLFEVSWEVCNKVGGIHTVVSTKAHNTSREVKNHIMIGPDVLNESSSGTEFVEDLQLLKSWRLKVQEEGLRIRIGRWDIAGSPVTILVDYTTFIPQKDKIFSEFWETYKLDSISGQWDYIEPALFGYATGKVIESYLRFNLASRHKVVAIFHEWMTGSGLLYLKSHVPQVATMFTTHATVMGRCIAGNGQPLYDNLKNYDADIKARELNVTAKQSLERCSAQYADCFSTVSDITAQECKAFLGKEVDLVTPNGFDSNIVPSGESFEEVRSEGRSKLLEVAEALLGCKAAENTMLVGIGGRYEFKNKGIDVFIESLSKLNTSPDLNRPIYAFILVPAGHHGPRKDLLHNITHKDAAHPLEDSYTTHGLVDTQYDPALGLARRVGLLNRPEDKVKLFFCPSYLNGDDGVFNKKYYDLLIGLDISMFPSYYEPWGYTPMESVAFKVPTITTTLAGFGLWVNMHYQSSHAGIEVIERRDDNDAAVIDEMVKKVLDLSALSPDDFEAVRENAWQVSSIALWDNLIFYYKEAFSIALGKVEDRMEEIISQTREEPTPYINPIQLTNQPMWNRIIVHKNIPQNLAPLEDLSRNLWWSWNQEAVDLYKSIDKLLWIKSEYNPIAFLGMISLTRYQELEKDKEFLARLSAVYACFKGYMAQKSSLFDAHVGNAPIEKRPPERPDTIRYKIAYFSMEYGLHTSLKIYSGGLGILAGDYLKEASDKGTPMVGVGLLYRYGYFSQKLSATGDQVAEYDDQDFMKIPASPVRDKDNKWITVSLAMPGRMVFARVWRVNVGRTELYLLDTDFEDNLMEDRSITHQLYGGNWENRLKQELMLGVGGIRALRAIGINADVYHCNEGHAAFIGLERIRELVGEKHLTFSEALEVVRASSLFTTHTPVPAGHDAFDEGLLRTYISHYPQRLKTTWEDLMKLGKVNVNNPGEKFSMSNLACSCSQEVNGVSWLHGKVSREILCGMWPGYQPEELHIGYVTNGVHYDTWTSNEWKLLQTKAFGPEFKEHHYDKSCFDGIYNVPDEKIWDLRNKLRNKLVRYVRQRLGDNKILKYHTPRQLVEVRETFRDDILTIGFARRFATYKRAHLLFKNLDRLNAIVNNPKMPVQFVFAGKAHPADKAGQDLIKRIVEVSKYPQFIGKILFLQNYDMRVARKMVAGVDIWMNTPTRPLEASGTSGEKAVMNGVMNLSVLDGWWVEGYKENAGWALSMERSYENQDFQDELDSETIYALIENEIAPKFYKRDVNNIPTEWVQMIKNTIAKVASNFTTNRMLQDYEERYYNKLYERCRNISANDFAKAKDMAEWKRHVGRQWESIEVIFQKQLNMQEDEVMLGNVYQSEVQLDIASLDSGDVGVELVIAEQEPNGKMKVVDTSEYACISHVGSVATYAIDVLPDRPGVIFTGVRLYAKNPDLPHRQDFALVRWI
ncbi:MAG: alpha-glucan family phosphorylase [Prevotellaceae bacterium]|jgi:phosphorylase/glycogen(starch) synthase|nr:alpha-glucan family phosphorylase [Prevotellaceae bacterium]